MDAAILIKRSKSSASFKNKPAMPKELQSLAKQSITPSSRRAMIKNIMIPHTTRAYNKELPSATFFKKPSINLDSNSPSKRSISKGSSKPGLRDLVSIRVKKNSLPSSRKILNSGSPKMLSPRKPLKVLKSTSQLKLERKPPKLSSTDLKNATLKNRIKSFGFRSNTGSVSGKPKANNQDDFFVCKDFASCRNQTLFGVMDGHGLYGHEVSGFVKTHLPLLIENSLPYESNHYSALASADSPPSILSKFTKAFQSAFTNIQKSLISKRTIDINYSGTTAITVLMRGNICICANAGDSRAIIGRFNDVWYPVELSFDHKPNLAEEKARIIKKGGRVEPYKEENGQFVGPDRVWLQFDQLPGLAMSRSIGDLVAAHVGVIAEPEVIIHELSELDKFVVIASDGVWEFISSHHCVRIVAEFYDDLDVEKACDALLACALNSWRTEDSIVDDITFIIAFLGCN